MKKIGITFIIGVISCLLVTCDSETVNEDYFEYKFKETGTMHNLFMLNYDFFSPESMEELYSLNQQHFEIIPVDKRQRMDVGFISEVDSDFYYRFTATKGDVVKFPKKE